MNSVIGGGAVNAGCPQVTDPDARPAATRECPGASSSVLADDTVDLRLAQREWVENADATKGEPGGTTPGSQKPVDSTAMVMQAAGAAQASYNAKLYEIEYKKAIGELVSLFNMESAVFETARRVRERLAALPARLAPVVAGLAGNQAACQRAIEAAANESLDEFTEVHGPAHSQRIHPAQSAPASRARGWCAGMGRQLAGIGVRVL